MPTPPWQYDNWPAGTDVRDMLKSAGFWPVSDEAGELALVQAENAIASAVEEFETNTGWHPFLSTGVINEVRYQDRVTPRGVVFLDDGLLTLTGVSVRGAAFAPNTNVFARPSNAPSRNQPYTMLEFYPRLYSQYVWPHPNGIVITGEWGRCRTVPRDAWTAVLRMAAVQALSAVDQPYALAGRTEDGFSEEYDVVGAIQPKDILGVWPKEFERIVSKYRRVDVG